jgi:hypothetical protein
MGYKMKGFSYPGKSPVKQSIVERYGAHKILDDEDSKKEKTYTEKDLAAYKEYYKNLYGDAKKDPTLEDKYTKEGVSKKEGMPGGAEGYLKSKGEGYNIWKDPKLREAITDPAAKKEMEEAQATEGLVGDEMATSKAEIKQRKTKSKTEQKTSGKTDEERGFGKVAQKIRQTGKTKKTRAGKLIKKAGETLVGISGKERAANKIQKLKGKKRLAKATGQLGVTADVLTGFKVTPQADKLKKRIKTKKAGIESKKTKKATKKIKADAKSKTK